jgi:hypothetical protein
MSIIYSIKRFSRVTKESKRIDEENWKKYKNYVDNYESMKKKGVYIQDPDKALVKSAMRHKHRVLTGKENTQVKLDEKLIDDIIKYRKTKTPILKYKGKEDYLMYW